MSNRGQLILGLAIVLVGVLLLVGNLLDVDVCALWPVGLILLGLWLFLRPQLLSSDTSTRQKLIGDVRRGGSWQVTDEEIWLGIGDVRLDMTGAEIPSGETRIRVWGFVSDVKLSLPQGVGVSVSSNAFISDVRGLGQKREAFLTPVHVASEDYEIAERKIRLETTYFVGEIRVRQV